LLGTPGGTVDLRTGIIKPGDPADGITKATAVAPSDHTDCPVRDLFLREATGGDRDMMRFLQHWAGYCLTSDTCEHALVFAHGPGGNGKSVFLNITGIMADYATPAPSDTFTVSIGERHPTEIAGLRGARLVSASETEQGRTWAETRIKTITGGDTVKARFMRCDYFSFRPAFSSQSSATTGPSWTTSTQPSVGGSTSCHSPISQNIPIISLKKSSARNGPKSCDG